MSERIWIRAHVEAMQETEEYVSFSRAEWDAMTEEQRDQAVIEAAVDAMNNAGGCGASIVDESEVPDEWRDLEES